MAQDKEMKPDVQQLEARLKEAKTIMQKFASYVGATQPQIDAINGFKEQFSKRAYQTAGVLAERGLIASSDVNQLVDKLASDELKVFDLVEKVARLVESDGFGKTSEVTVPAGVELDAFEKLALYGDPNGTPSLVNSGSVD